MVDAIQGIGLTDAHVPPGGPDDGRYVWSLPMVWVERSRGGEGEQEVEKLARGRQRKDTVKEKPGEMEGRRHRQKET
ncbi:hypothetical protein RRG08_028990 [Elysia crispata]|uniref:Uncharacterized protein n=1 Tax=Elysia crispata TaxID=231223 RepID=A0AAE1BFL6_9GAST|nr:hypothetical protein RRG08_028990 [Elysia crispata]